MKSHDRLFFCKKDGDKFFSNLNIPLWIEHPDDGPNQGNLVPNHHTEEGPDQGMINTQYKELYIFLQI